MFAKDEYIYNNKSIVALNKCLHNRCIYGYKLLYRILMTSVYLFVNVLFIIVESELFAIHVIRAILLGYINALLALKFYITF